MARRIRFVLPLLSLLSLPMAAAGQDVRTYTKDGVQYRESRRKILRPLTEVRYEERERTVYRQECSTDVREVERFVQVPVTEWEWEPYLVGRWNPFIKPYWSYRLVPRTRLETRSELVRCPVTSRRLIPHKRVERVPVTTRRMVEEEVVRRVAIPPSRAPLAPTSDRRLADRAGGIRMESDPPRKSTASQWRPAGGTRGRY